MDRAAILARYPRQRYRAVLLTECTRMHQGRYCLAGWDLRDERMVRPDLPHRATFHSPLPVGTLLDCRASGRRPTSAPPHCVEDLPLQVPPQTLEQIPAAATYALLRPTCCGAIALCFGEPLVDGHWLPEGSGARSLAGVCRPAAAASFVVTRYGKLRCRIEDVDGQTYDWPVTGDELQQEFARGGATALNRRLHQLPGDQDLLLRVGLTRGWDGGEDECWNPLRCFAQLNGVLWPD
ncbi:MAG: hypothetical protein IT204_07570 [Fimbriimonadaceae bacterium]|nr:hypothetical protein [Fimbriimonadaceae bacterium]